MADFKEILRTSNDAHQKDCRFHTNNLKDWFTIQVVLMLGLLLSSETLPYASFTWDERLRKFMDIGGGGDKGIYTKAALDPVKKLSS